MASASSNLDAIDDLINFALGDPDVTTDPRITHAAMQAALDGRTHYTDAMGSKRLRGRIADFHARTYGQNIALNEIMVTTSACHALYLALQAMCDPGDEVLIIEPFFTCYTGQIEAAGATPVVVSPGAEQGWRLQPQQLEAAITERTRAVILNTPSNPSGVHYSREELEGLCEVIRRHDLIALADDIYTAYVFDGEFTPLATLPGMAERTVTVRSFSKDWAMTGWRIGYILADPAFIAVTSDLNENIVFSAPEPVQAAAEEALLLADEIRASMRELYRSRVLHAYEQLSTVPGLRAERPGGGIYLWVDVRETGMNGREFAAFMLEHAHVAVIPGDAFGPNSGGFVRLALTVDEAHTDEAYARMARALREHR